MRYDGTNQGTGSNDNGEGTDFGSQCLVIVTRVSPPESLCSRVSTIVWFRSPLSFTFSKFCSSVFLVTIIPMLQKCSFYIRSLPDAALLFAKFYFSLLLSHLFPSHYKLAPKSNNSNSYLPHCPNNPDKWTSVLTQCGVDSGFMACQHTQ